MVGKPDGYIEENGLRSEFRVIRPHKNADGVYLVEIAGAGEHFIHEKKLHFTVRGEEEIG